MNQFKIMAPLRDAPVLPLPATLGPGYTLTVSGILSRVMSGDSVWEEIRTGKKAENACGALLQPAAPLLDGSTEPIQVFVPFLRRYSESEDNTLALSVACTALEHAFEAKVPIKVVAEIREWGLSLDSRRVNIRSITLRQMEEISYNEMSIGTPVCEGSSPCLARGTVIRFQTWVENVLDYPNLCSASLQVDENHRIDASVLTRLEYTRLMAGETVLKKAMYGFYLAQQCRNLLVSLCTQKVAEARGSLAGTGIIKASHVLVRDQEPSDPRSLTSDTP